MPTSVRFYAIFGSDPLCWYRPAETSQIPSKQAVMTPNSQEILSKTARRKVSLLLILSYLREERAVDALQTLKDVLTECPQDPDALMVLGVLYAAALPDQDQKRVLPAGAVQMLIDIFQTLEESEQHAASAAAAQLLDSLPMEARRADTNAALTDDMRRLMPALIERNIRRARASGEVDAAEALRSLEIALLRQVQTAR